MATRREKVYYELTAIDGASRVFKTVEGSAAALAARYRQLISVAGVAGVGGTLFSMVKSAIDSGDQLVKLSQKTGFAVERLGELKHGAMLSDVSMEQLTIGLREFNKSITEASNPTSKAAKLFRELGVDVKKGPDAALRQFSDAISRMTDASTRATLAGEILGRTVGADMVPWLMKGAAGMDQSAEEARKLGLVMSQKAAVAAEEFNDTLTLLASSSTALGIAIADPTLPALNAMAERMMKIRTEGVTLAGTLENLGSVLRRLPIPGASLAGTALDAGLAAGRAELQRYRGGPDLWKRVGSINLSGLDAELQAGAPPPGAPNSKALDRILSGVADKDAAAAAKLAAERQLQQDVQAAGRSQLAADREAEFLNNMDEALKRQAERISLTHDEQQQVDQLAQKYQMLADREAEFSDPGKLETMLDSLKKVDAAAVDLGWAFASAFETAVIEGKNASAVVRGLGQDIARIALRQLVTQPMANAISGALAGIFGGAGGSMAGAAVTGVPAYASGTDYVPRTGLALVHQGERITPAGQNGDGAPVNLTIYFSANTPAASRDAVYAAAPVLIEGAKRAVFEAMNRGAR
jgi:hypothetical protein